MILHGWDLNKIWNYNSVQCISQSLHLIKGSFTINDVHSSEIKEFGEEDKDQIV